MARILILTPQLPYPPQQGTTLRNFNLIAGLTRRGHVVDLVTFAEKSPTEPPCPTGPLLELCRRVITMPHPKRTMVQRARDTVLQPLPDMALRLEDPAMHACVHGLLAENEYDVMEVEGIEMAPYALAEGLASRAAGQPARRGEDDQGCMLPGRNAPLLVFDDHNAEYVLQQRAFLTDVRQPRRWLGAAYSFVQWQKLTRYERRICRAADRVAAVSEADREALRQLLPGLEVTVVPNGVDLDYFRPGAVPSEPGLARQALVFTGKMDYRPNVDAVLWFASEVLPLIRAQAPKAHLYVVGQQPHARLAGLAEQPGITMTGRVPDVRPYLAGAAVCVIPLRIGGGTRLKVLEAMATGLPIVSTHLGCDGFPFQDGREVRLADDPAAFAAAVCELLRDRAQAARLGDTARSYVTGQYGWDQIVPLMEHMYGR